jgi:hypothetical protein
MMEKVAHAPEGLNFELYVLICWDFAPYIGRRCFLYVGKKVCKDTWFVRGIELRKTLL